MLCCLHGSGDAYALCINVGAWSTPAHMAAWELHAQYFKTTLSKSSTLFDFERDFCDNSQELKAQSVATPLG